MTAPVPEIPVVMPSNVIEIKFHPVADIFPLLDGGSFDALVADIRAHGLREPITLHPDGRILDGRNRYRACLAASVEPRFRTWDGTAEGGTSLLAYVLSLNLHRRHMDESQRSMVAARIANMRQGARTDLAQSCATSQTEAAELLNVSRRSVQFAREVLDHGRLDEIEAVDAGEVPVYIAAKTVHARINAPRNVVRRSKAAARNAARSAECKAHGSPAAEVASSRPASTGEEGNREPSPVSDLLKKETFSTPFLLLLPVEIGTSRMQLIDAAQPDVKREILVAIVQAIDERLGEVAS